MGTADPWSIRLHLISPPAPALPTILPNVSTHPSHHLQGTGGLNNIKRYPHMDLVNRHEHISSHFLTFNHYLCLMGVLKEYYYYAARQGASYLAPAAVRARPLSFLTAPARRPTFSIYRTDFFCLAAEADYHADLMRALFNGVPGRGPGTLTAYVIPY